MASADDPSANEDEDDDDVFDEDDDCVERPCLRQRFSPIAAVMTTVHPAGLVIQVLKPWKQSSFAVGFERLVLDPASINSLRPGLLWTAGALCAAALGVALAVSPDVARAGAADVAQAVAAGVSQLGAAGVAVGDGTAGLAPGGAAQGPATLFVQLIAPLLLVMAILALMVAVTHPRRVTLFLDREAGMHPSFLRGGPGETEAEAFVALVRRAIVEYRCRPPESGETGPVPAPRLASTLDRLLAMQREELLTEPELAHFRELALRR